MTYDGFERANELATGKSIETGRRNPLPGRTEEDMFRTPDARNTLSHRECVRMYNECFDDSESFSDRHPNIVKGLIVISGIGTLAAGAVASQYLRG